MGYFSNGSEGMDYERKWCDRCIHHLSDDDGGCPVIISHLLWNYDECNKPDSVLHKMIPRSADGLSNEKCYFFLEGKSGGEASHD